MFLYYTAGMYCFYHLQDAAIKKAHSAEALRENKSEELVELRFALAEIQWEDEHEFYHAGKLYDIVSAKQTNDSLFCVAYHDGEEQTLKENYNAFIGGETKQKEQQQPSFKLYPKFLAEQKIVFVYTYTYLTAKQPAHQNTDPAYVLVFSPPPEV
jgi:hypothetical protein